MWKNPIFERLRLKKRVKNVTPKKKRIWLFYLVRVVAGVVPSVSVDGFLGSTPDDAILKYAFPSKFDLGIDSRGNRFDVLSRQWLRAFGQIVGSTPTFILF